MINKRGEQIHTVIRNLLVKRGFLAVLITILVLGTAVPAAATPFTSTDGVISINLPNGNWTEIEDPDHWISLSDGSSLITIQHFANGEKLPEIPVAASPYVRTLSASVSTENEVFIAFAYVTDSNEMYDIYEALSSLRILQYDTKSAAAGSEADSSQDETAPAQSEAAPAQSVTASDFSVVPADMVLYVHVSEEDGGALNVRKGFSTKSDLIGKLDNGASVQVIGVVQMKGSDYGWYKIAYEDGYGYVSANYLTDTAPDYTEYTDYTEYPEG